MLGGSKRGRDGVYVTAAAGLGIAWCVLVRLFFFGGGWTWRSESIERCLWMGSLVVTCTLISILFRPWIRWSRGFRSLITGTVLMYAGVVGVSLFRTGGLVVTDWNREPFDSFTPTTPFDFFPFCFYGLLFATYYGYVTIPAGVVSVAVLRWIDAVLAKRSVTDAATSTRAI